MDLLYSPLSAEPTLALLYAGTTGETRAVLREILGIEETEDTEAMLFRLAADLKSIREHFPAGQYQLSSSFWFHGRRLSLHLRQKFWFQEVFQVDVRAENYRRDSGAQERLDDWATCVTRGRFLHLPFPQRPSWIPQDQPYPFFICTNSLYFNLPWKVPFVEYQYCQEYFSIASGGKRLSRFMVGKEKPQGSEIGYFSEELFHAIQIPFEGERFVMEIFLPHASQGLTEMLKKFDFSEPGQWTSKFTFGEELHVLLPCFRLQLKTPMTYEKLGEKYLPIFRPGREYDGLYEKKKQEELIGISDILQVIDLGIDMEGVHAGDFEYQTDLTQEDSHIPPRDEGQGGVFLAMHPFYFQIRDQLTGRYIYMGVLRELAGWDVRP